MEWPTVSASSYFVTWAFPIFSSPLNLTSHNELHRIVPSEVVKSSHPESDFENTSKLFIRAGNKNSDAVFGLTGKSLRSSLHSSRRVYDFTNQRKVL